MIETLPDYLTNLPPHEQGTSLNIPFASYRALARSALSIAKGVDHLMAVYKLPEQRGCVLDIFLSCCGLSICVDSQVRALQLFVSDLDSGDSACLLSVDDSLEGWQRLHETATEIISGKAL